MFTGCADMGTVYSPRVYNKSVPVEQSSWLIVSGVFVDSIDGQKVGRDPWGNGKQGSKGYGTDDVRKLCMTDAFNTNLAGMVKACVYLEYLIPSC